MVNVELSNIWNCLSLPELLAGEKDLFDAHRHLRANEPGGNDFLGFLGLPDAVTARTLHAIRQAADSIRQAGGTLVVAGHGGPYFAAQAGIDLLLGRNRALRGAKPRVLFTGDNLSSRDWLELCDLLAGEDYSLLLLSPDGAGFETCVASRAMRWMMERRYGPEAKERVYVAAPEGTPLYKMGKEEGYALLPSPRELGGAESALSSGALAAMAAAGIEPLDLLEGAAEAYRTMDVRAFENPAWLYAGSRVALSARGRRLEMIGCFDPSMNSFGLWLKQYLCRHACRDGLGALPVSASLPRELDGLDAMELSARSPLFETVVTAGGLCQRKLNVEMDWKDYDGLGYLAGKTVADAEAAVVQGLVAARFGAGVPVVCIDCPETDGVRLGELFYFFELSAALSACASGIEPFDCPPSPTRAEAEKILGKG